MIHSRNTRQFTDIRPCPTEGRDVTSLTVDEFQPLVRSFEAAFQAHMAPWRLDERPGTARRYPTYQNGPLPTPEDQLLCILASPKTYPLQVVQGRLFGMAQSTAHQWLPLLFLTHNRRDFRRPHHLWSEGGCMHYGIIISISAHIPLPELERRMLRLLSTYTSENL